MKMEKQNVRKGEDSRVSRVGEGAETGVRGGPSDRAMGVQGGEGVRDEEPGLAAYRNVDNVDADGVQVRSELSADGRFEIPDPVPVGVPLGYRPSPTLRDTIERIMMNHQLAVLADMEGFDSPEEAEDFLLEDDPLDPLTPYEAHFFPAPAPSEPASPAPAGASPGGIAPATEGAANVAAPSSSVLKQPNPPAQPGEGSVASFSPEMVQLFEQFSAWSAAHSRKSST